MSSLEGSLRRLRLEFNWANVREYEYVIFGSTSLKLRGILDREPGDIDVFVSKRVWGTLLTRSDWHVLTPRAGDPPILELDSHPKIHLFFDWTERDRHWMVPQNVFKSASKVGGWMCASPEEVRKHKEFALAMGHRKHESDILQIDETFKP